jgi:splicing factor 1
MKTLPNYHPPADYRRPTKTQEKVYVPVNDYPEINFSMELTPLTFLSWFSSALAFVLTACSGCPMLMRVRPSCSTAMSLTLPVLVINTKF